MVTLPSKKVFSVFVLIAALVVAVIIVFGGDKSSSAINFTSNLVAGEKMSLPENPSWQNELGGITAGTEPIQTEDDTSDKETITDTVSKTLMSNYLTLKQGGGLDQTSAQELIDKTLSYIEKTGGQVVQVSQLNIVPDNGKESVMKYGENLGSILRNNKPESLKNELEIINISVSTRDPSKINELDMVIVVYEKIASELIRMPVPKIFVKAHLDIVNGVNGMAAALREIKDIFSDPLKGLSAMQMYRESAAMFMQAIRATSVFISQNKIVYKQGSGGYYLLYGI